MKHTQTHINTHKVKKKNFQNVNRKIIQRANVIKKSLIECLLNITDHLRGNLNNMKIYTLQESLHCLKKDNEF